MLHNEAIVDRCDMQMLVSHFILEEVCFASLYGVIQRTVMFVFRCASDGSGQRTTKFECLFGSVNWAG